MVSLEAEDYDLVGVGLGPSNLSLAIALQEIATVGGSQPMNSLFLERQRSLQWHPGMLFPTARMQVSFLKDLVTFRDPTSSFSFVKYLHAVGRLGAFVNNQDFFPSREEFQSYLEWAESQLLSRPSFNSEVTAIRPSADCGGPGPIQRMQVEIRDVSHSGRDEIRVVHTRNVAIGTGLVPKMPAELRPDELIWHSSQFLGRLGDRVPGTLRRVAVVGAGQSAAEIVRFLYDSVPEAKIFAILPPYGYSVADDTPLANQVFDPDAVDDYYYGSDRSRDAIWRYHSNTNYAVADGDIIKDLHRRMYEDRVRGCERIELVRLARVVRARRSDDGVRVTVHSLTTDQLSSLDVDVLVCATGYSPMDPSAILGEIDAFALRDARGRYRVGRDHRLMTTQELRCGIYFQGGTEHSHGLSSSLLSNVAMRSGEIVKLIAEGRGPAPN